MKNLFEENTHFKLPTFVLALRICVEIYRVLSQDELKLSIQLTKYYNIKRQFKTEWCKNTKYLPFDFVIDERRIIIELDGPQHFKQVSNWISPEINLTNDLFKMDCANKNGFSVIRILQEDVLHDRYDWLSELINKIELISDENIIVSFSVLTG